MWSCGQGQNCVIRGLKLWITLRMECSLEYELAICSMPSHRLLGLHGENISTSIFFTRDEFLNKEIQLKEHNYESRSVVETFCFNLLEAALHWICFFSVRQLAEPCDSKVASHSVHSSRSHNYNGRLEWPIICSSNSLIGPLRRSWNRKQEVTFGPSGEGWIHRCDVTIRKS